MKILQEIKNAQFKTQEEMAAYIGVSQPTLSDWLSGKEKPSIKNVKVLTELFGIPREQLRKDIYG